MSHIGKKSIHIPSGVEVTLKNIYNQGQLLEIGGKLGIIKIKIPVGLGIKYNSKEISLKSHNNFKKYPLWSTISTIINNNIVGVSQGFNKKLRLIGIGYRASVENNNLILKIGYSHPIDYQIPVDVEIKCSSNQDIEILGIDKQRVSQVAAEIRNFKKPEPYKGTGILYETEVIKLKQGKKK